jgi:hypothetical protein
MYKILTSHDFKLYEHTLVFFPSGFCSSEGIQPLPCFRFVYSSHSDPTSVSLSHSGDLQRDPSPDMSCEIVVTNSSPPQPRFPGMYMNGAKILNFILLRTCPHGKTAHRGERSPTKGLRNAGPQFYLNLRSIIIYMRI